MGFESKGSFAMKRKKRREDKRSRKGREKDEQEATGDACDSERW
jgi:hypothetical protein